MTVPSRAWPDRRSVGRLALGFEAAVALTVARLAMFLPFRSATAILGQVEEAPFARRSAPGVAMPVASVAWAVPAAARRMPWRTTCLQEAYAAVLMLRRRAVATETVVGVRRCAGPTVLAAHAWVETAQGDVVVGRRGHRPFHPLAVYRQAPRRRFRGHADNGG